MKMSTDAAATALYDALREIDGLVAVGIGRQGEKDCLYVYVQKAGPATRELIPDLWNGYPVVVKPMKAPRPLAQRFRGRI